MALKIPLMYFCIHERLQGKFKNSEFTRKEFGWLFGKVYPIDKRLRNPVIKELQNFNLIRSIGSNKFVVLKNNFNLNNTSKIYRSVGLY
jgi:hypothetical protein